MFQYVKTVSSVPRVDYIGCMGDEAVVAPSSHAAICPTHSRYALRSCELRSTAPHAMNPTIRSLIFSDWSPHIEKTVRAICIPIAAVYVAGCMAGEWLVQLTDAFTALTCPQAPVPVAQPAPAPVIVQRCAVAPVIARCGIQAPDPMARAVSAVMGGMSQAAAARRYGVSRSTLRRRIAR